MSVYGYSDIHPPPVQVGLLVLSKTSMLNSQFDIPISRSKRAQTLRPWMFQDAPMKLKAPCAH
jgi:hypothetical protein